MIGGRRFGPSRSWTVTLSVLALTVAALTTNSDAENKVSATEGQTGQSPTLAIEDAAVFPEVQRDTETSNIETSTVETSTVETSTVPTVSTAPVAASTTPPVTEPQKTRLVINAVGDVNVDPRYIPALASEGYEHALSGLDGLFLEDDLTIINLECPASELGQIVPKQFNFRCDVEALGALRRLGVDVANQGNNHILDYGKEAMLDSIEQLRLVGIAPVGAGANAAEAHMPAIFSINGWTVAVLGFGGVVPNGSWIATEDRPGMADGDTIETMVAAVEAAAAIADIVAVTIHWGVELQSGPPADDVRRAEAMIDAGADMIFGHHPHRLNALENYRDRPVSWSLGNFVWPRLSAAGSDTAVAQVIVEPDGRIRSCHLDATIVSDGHPELDDPSKRSC